MGCNCGKGGQRMRRSFPPPAGIGGPPQAPAEQPAGMLDPALARSRVVRSGRMRSQTFRTEGWTL